MFWPLLILHHTTDAVLFDWSDPSRATIDPSLPAPVPSRSTCTTGCRGGRWWSSWSSHDDWPCRMCNSADPALLNILVVHLYMKPYIGKTMNFSNYLRTCTSEIRGWYGWGLTYRSPMEGRSGSGLWDGVAHIARPILDLRCWSIILVWNWPGPPQRGRWRIWNTSAESGQEKC